MPVATGCSSPVTLDDLREPMDPRPSYASYRRDMEGCAALTGRRESGVHWYVTDRLPGAPDILAQWNARHEITIRRDARFDRSVVMHETPQELLAGDDAHRDQAGRGEGNLLTPNPVLFTVAALGVASRCREPSPVWQPTGDVNGPKGPLLQPATRFLLPVLREVRSAYHQSLCEGGIVTYGKSQDTALPFRELGCLDAGAGHGSARVTAFPGCGLRRNPGHDAGGRSPAP